MVKYTTLTEDEKDTIVKISKTIVKKSEQARREGILALEEDIDDLPEQIGGMYGKFAAKLLRYVVDGQDGQVISNLADNFTESSCETDFERLCFKIIKEGVLSIQCGDNPHIIEEKFISHTGLSGEDDFRARTGFDSNLW